MQTIVQAAEADLSQIIEKTIAGETVIIESSDKQQFKLVQLETKEEKDWFGMDAGKIWIADDFDETPEDFIRAVYGEDEK